MTTPVGMNDQSVVRGLELRLDTARAGLMKLAPGTMVTVGLVQYTATDLVKLVESISTPFKKKRDVKTALRALLQTEPQDKADAKDFLGDLKAGVVTLLGRKSEQLADFGFKPEVVRRRKLTVEEKVVQAAKRQATREMRGTRGKRQRAALKATGTPPITIAQDGSIATAKPTVTPPRTP